MSDILFQAFVYLCAAVIAVPIAKRMGLGSVLGYLIAGVVIGPMIGLVGAETQDIQHVAEFGVVMMLFLVGLELEPSALWAMRARLLGLGGLQVGLTTSAIAAIAYLSGIDWRTALVVGMVLALSSTAIVLQTLGEKGLTRSDGGKASFSVLIFQDIAAIPMLALIPLLAIPELASYASDAGASADSHHSLSLVEGLPGWQVALVNVCAIAAVIVGGHYLSRPLFRFIAKADLREIFTAASLLLVIGIALLMTLVGLSPALGAFLAGVVLANSEFRHELETSVEPFKGLLLGLFFITVGAGIDFALLFSQVGLILALTVGLILLKALVLVLLSALFKLRGGDRWLFTLGLAQAGEFGFVLLAFAVQSSAIDKPLAATLLLVVALSMLLTPALFIALDKLILPRLDAGQGDRADEIDEHAPIIIAGLGRFGQIINRVMLANGNKTVVLDHRADLIDGMRKFGVKTYYGDASRPDLLHAAGLKTARLLVVAIDDPDNALQIVAHARREHPKLHIVARARDRNHVYRLFRAGATDIVRETFDSATRAARYSLNALGADPKDAQKRIDLFISHDLAGIRELAEHWDPDQSNFENTEYIRATVNRMAELEAVMRGDQTAFQDPDEHDGITPGESPSQNTPPT